MGMVVLFFDGVGLGREDPGVNPFAAIGARRLAPAAGRPAESEAAFRPLDPRLGVPGLPQSATGQTTLFTGVNAARVLGRHHSGTPGPTLRRVLTTESLFVKLCGAGASPTFANAYTTAHLTARRPRWSATTHMVLASGAPLRLLDDPAPAALPAPAHFEPDGMMHDYVGDFAARRGIAVVPRSAAQAAARLASYLDGHDLVLYEYFLTDLMAHRGTAEECLEQARRVEALTDAVVGAVDLARHAVIVISDHGNLEDGEHRQHTENFVPLLGWGAGSRELVQRVSGMDELTPALVEALARDCGRPQRTTVRT